VQREVATARAEDTRRQVNAALTQQLAATATAFEQIDIAQANVAAATEDLRVQNERYRVGAATILDLLTSQAALTQAQVNLVQTRFNYLIARAQVEAVVGRTL
jgi:outer membrane protein TolC